MVVYGCGEGLGLVCGGGGVSVGLGLVWCVSVVRVCGEGVVIDGLSVARGGWWWCVSVARV